MNVLMISPGFPAEMPLFTRGLSRVGATVIGLGDQPQGALPEDARASLSAYVQVGSFADETAVLEQVQALAVRTRIDRVECLWEPFMILAARMREMLGLPGMTIQQTVPFRDKEIMKQVLDRAGIRTPRHARADSATAVREAVESIGYPLIVKPIAGAGSSDTYRLDSERDLERALQLLRHVPEVSVEEFVDGEDFTFDSICVDGRIAHYNIAFYRPRALIAKENEWISPQTVAVRDVDSEALEPGRRMGIEVLRALGFQSGYTHMEWYRKPDGEAVFGEIAARPPGARLVDLINFASDVDTYTGWAEAVTRSRFSQVAERKYNSAFIIKRAEGQGTIRRIDGLSGLMAEYGPHVCAVDLAPVGSPRRNWRQVLVADGIVMVRHPDLQRTMEIADAFATRLQLHAA
jgi:formate-dependent phosphoribosylglycinamide formyltransferase (GAR transformylase)